MELVLEAPDAVVGADERERRVSGPARTDLEEVFRRDYQVVVGVAARVLATRDEAEDVAQEAFLYL